ncbi:MAG: hypothetical protein Q4G16_05600 [Cruoricaptor ignavus]|nr:hypothetical protein [Cruoricaptor ignavus]
MRKLFLSILFSFITICINAQYDIINARLKILEEKRGINQDLKNVDINNKKFYLIRDFDDHTERLFLSINGDKATYAEVFDDKSNDESTSNVFSGDVIRTKKNLLSFRFDTLEGEKIALPLTKNLILTKQRNTIYLIDITNKERWIDEASLKK